MLGLAPLRFLRALLAGFFATFLMEVTGYYQQGVGLPRLDASEVLAKSARRSKLWGSYAHYMIGILLSLGYARWIEPLLRGPAILKGTVYGLATALLADGFVMPVIDSRVGPFYSRTPHPERIRAGSFAMHLTYGLALSLLYAEQHPKIATTLENESGEAPRPPARRAFLTMPGGLKRLTSFLTRVTRSSR